jgi:CubicO group peptidase (beta-lactamase class C family)
MRIIGICSFLILSNLSINAQNINQDNLDKLSAFVDSTGANEMRVYHQGELISTFSDPSCNKKMNTASMVKSWTGLVMGALIDNGIIDSENDLTCKYLPEWQAGCDGKVTIKHLLTMSAGLKKKIARNSVLAAKNHNEFVINLALDNTPGEKFSYSNESAQLLGVIMEKASGKTMDQLYEDYLFGPLNIKDSKLYQDEAGNYIVYGGMETSIESAVKIGQMVINNGRYNGEQIISSRWIEASTSPSSTSAYYGYLWWVDTQNKNFTAMGDFGQMTIIFPEKKLLFVRQQSCNNSDPGQNMRWMGIPFIQMIASVVD